MIELVVAAPMWQEVSDIVLGDSTERCAVLFAHQVDRPTRGVRLLVHQIIAPASPDYALSSPLEAELTPAFVARVTKAARISDYAIIFVHSHPGESAPRFSTTDDHGERQLAGFLAHRHKKVHASMVVSAGGVRCRQLGTKEDVRVISLSACRDVLSDTSVISNAAEGTYDRQIRALGAEGQKALESLTVGIVGLGGTGSLVAQQLVHLGVSNFVLIDPDVIESSNLNRVANATATDIGHPKVAVAKRYINAFSRDPHVAALEGDVIWARHGKALLDTDIIFGCTDSHGSRAVLEQISYQYMVPLIDMGSIITIADQEIKQIVGRIQMLSPGLACFTCSGLLDPEQVRRDMMNAFERKSDPYVQGAHEPAPAVMSLNGTVASLSVTMAIAAVTTLPVPARHLIYRALSSSLRAVATTPEAGCLICSLTGRLARGDSWPFPGRQD